MRCPAVISTVQTFISCTSRRDDSQCLVVLTPLHGMSKNKPSTSMTHAACESTLLSNVRSPICPCQRNWVATDRAVLYYARADHTFSAGIKCRHCVTVADINAVVFVIPILYCRALLRRFIQTETELFPGVNLRII